MRRWGSDGASHEGCRILELRGRISFKSSGRFPPTSWVKTCAVRWVVEDGGRTGFIWGCPRLSLAPRNAIVDHRRLYAGRITTVPIICCSIWRTGSTILTRSGWHSKWRNAKGDVAGGAVP